MALAVRRVAVAEYAPPRVEFDRRLDRERVDGYDGRTFVSYEAMIRIDLPPAEVDKRWYPGGFSFYGVSQKLALPVSKFSDAALQQGAMEKAIFDLRRSARNMFVLKEHRESLLVALDQILEDPRTQSVLRGEGWK